MEVGIVQRRRLFAYTANDTFLPVEAKSVEDAIAGFEVGVASIFRISYERRMLSRYHYYGGGATWTPIAPREVSSSENPFKITVTKLNTREFIRELPEIRFLKTSFSAWLPTTTVVTAVRLSNGRIEMKLSQDPPIERISKFKITGALVDRLRFYSGQTMVDVIVSDHFGSSRTLRVYHDGGARASLGISRGKRFDSINAIGFDGYRLMTAYRMREPSIEISTLYLRDPIGLYNLGDLTEGIPAGKSSSFHESMSLCEIGLTRDLERRMLATGSAYDHGRIGAEIAYSIARTRLGLSQVTMADPSRPGEDLVAKPSRVAIEARMLTRTRAMSKNTQAEEISRHLDQMLRKLSRQVITLHVFRVGYAILTHQMDSGLESIIAKVDAHQTSSAPGEI